jgi:SAM-dependent methyltransferase
MKNKDAMLAHYSGLLEEYGLESRSLDWPTVEVQERNFRAVAQAFAHERDEFSVYEIGCGLGDMATFLQRHYPRARYAGCDINENLVRRALLAHPGLEVEVRDILESPPCESDYVVASGIFNLHMSVPEAQWQEFIFAMLRVMFGSARRGVAANFHTSYVDWRKTNDYYQDPCAAFDFAKRELSRFVELRHAYYPWEFAMIVYREAMPL